MTDQIRESIRAAMERQGISQSELSRRTGVKQATISLYLSGSIDPRISTIAAMASGLGVTLSVS